MKRGRKPYIPSDSDRRLVKAMASFGVTQDDICRMIHNPKTSKAISLATLNKFYRTELDTGVIEANFKVANAMFKAATSQVSGPMVRAAEMWLKCRAGWRESAHSVEFLGKDGEPQNLSPMVVQLVVHGDDLKI